MASCKERIESSKADGLPNMLEKTSSHGGLDSARPGLDEHNNIIEKRLKRKLDLRLVAMVWLIYTLNYLDRNNIAAAGVWGIQQSLDLTPTQYSTAIALLFAGYITMQIPSNVFLARLRPNIYIPTCMVAWGTISACTGVVQNVGGLYTARVFLGIVEAALFPGALFLIASWYRKDQLGVRGAVLYSGSQVGSALSGLLAAGIASGLDGAENMRAWRWIFIIEGSITVAIAFLSAFILPNYSQNTWWLTKSEKDLVNNVWTLDSGRATTKAGPWTSGLTTALMDWRVYLFSLMLLCAQVSSGVTNFFPQVVATLGFNRIGTLLLTVPPYIVAMFACIGNNYVADRTGNSHLTAMWPLTMAIIGYIIISTSLNSGARYFAMFLVISGGHASNTVLLGWLQKTLIVESGVTRAAAVAMANSIGNCGQIIASYLYRPSDAPRYILAMCVNSGFALLGIILISCTVAYTRIETRRRSLQS